jgi:hypothetical protein
VRILGPVALLILLALCGATALHAQDTDAPVFRSDADAVTFEFTAKRQNPWTRSMRPWTDLKIGDMKVVLDGKEYAPTTMSMDKPGHYVMSLLVPNEYRDGKEHTAQFKVKKSTFPFSRTFTVQKGQDPAAADANQPR